MQFVAFFFTFHTFREISGLFETYCGQMEADQFTNGQTFILSEIFGKLTDFWKLSGIFSQKGKNFYKFFFKLEKFPLYNVH